mmetsp:Transcript_611/g.1909  ORF Transcript_611/g.1909 Transcript_611/m.1909 type:complete len:330 (-) Transcript_611:84-1073(-)
MIKPSSACGRWWLALVVLASRSRVSCSYSSGVAPLPLIGVLRGLPQLSQDLAKDVVLGVLDAGFPAISVPCEATEQGAAEGLLHSLIHEFGHRAVFGMSTLTHASQVSLACEAGARFVSTKYFDEAIVRSALSLGLEPVSGVQSLDDALRALNAGARYLKLYSSSRTPMSIAQDIATELYGQEGVSCSVPLLSRPPPRVGPPTTNECQAGEAGVAYTLPQIFAHEPPGAATLIASGGVNAEALQGLWGYGVRGFAVGSELFRLPRDSSLLQAMPQCGGGFSRDVSNEARCLACETRRVLALHDDAKWSSPDISQALDGLLKQGTVIAKW